MTTTTKTLTAKFAGTCKRCNGRFAAGTTIEWTKAAGAMHTGTCPAPAPVPVTAPVSVGSFSGVIALFAKASASGLKFPKITLLCEGKVIRLSVAGARSKTPGSVTIAGEGVFPNREWYGRVSPDGAWIPARGAAALAAPLTALLTEFAANPAAVAKAHGKLTGNCCFCNKVLGKGKDKRSIGVGYGPDCAENYGLKAEWLKGAAELDATFSTAVTPEVAVA
jgi:hypothetical protein